MADIIKQAKVTKNGTKYRMSVRYDSDEAGRDIRASSSGHVITPPSAKSSTGEDQQTSWDAVIAPPPEPETRFTFNLGASYKDTIYT